VARLIASELVHRCGGSDGIVLRRTIFPINPGSVDPRAPVAPRAKLLFTGEAVKTDHRCAIRRYGCNTRHIFACRTQVRL